MSKKKEKHPKTLQACAAAWAEDECWGRRPLSLQDPAL